MHTIGLIVNPVAGMGGSVGLKGTDGDSYARALEMGAEPVSPARTHEFLSHIGCRDQIRLLVAPGPMGAGCAEAAGLDFEIVGELAAQPAAEDTKRMRSIFGFRSSRFRQESKSTARFSPTAREQQRSCSTLSSRVRA